MDEPRAQLKDPCRGALEWANSNSDVDVWMQMAVQSILEHGIWGAQQELVLARTCRECGIRATCEYRDSCTIQQPEPALQPRFENSSTVDLSRDVLTKTSAIPCYKRMNVR